MASRHLPSNPKWTLAAPLIAAGFLTLKYSVPIAADAIPVLAAAALLLGGSVFAAVHHAEIMALKLGEPFGSVLLAVAVTIIEVALIVSVMLSDAPGGTDLMRDTIFATVMIVLNGIIGLCLVLGGQRHFEQSFQLQGATSAFAVLGTLAGVTLILPNHTLAAAGPYFSPFQIVVVDFVSFSLWCIFIFVQTVKHRDYFLDVADSSAGGSHERPSRRVALVSLVLLPVSLGAVVQLAKLLSAPLDRAVAAIGLPQAFVGVVIATLVLLPEGIAAIKSALRNRIQNSINLSVGSAIASIGLTIPIVTIIALLAGKKATLGISPANVTLLSLTLFVSTLTLCTGRTTVLQGAVHLVIFAVFLMISAVP